MYCLWSLSACSLLFLSSCSRTLNIARLKLMCFIETTSPSPAPTTITQSRFGLLIPYLLLMKIILLQDTHAKDSDAGSVRWTCTVTVCHKSVNAKRNLDFYADKRAPQKLRPIESKMQLLMKKVSQPLDILSWDVQISKLYILVI